MTAVRVRFHVAARQELAAAIQRYDSELAGLGDDLLAEVEQVVQTIAAHPEAGTPHQANTRRLVLKRFPFTLIYRAMEQDIVILAIAHQRRRPTYWLRRL